MRMFPKKLLRAAVAIFISNPLAAQTNFSISGNVRDSKETSVELKIDRNWLNIKPEVISAPLKDGHFEIAANLDRNRMVELNSGVLHLPLYAEPGDHVEIDVSGFPDTKISVSGTGVAQNLFLQQFFNQFRDDYNDSIVSSKMLSSTIDAFENELFTQRKLQLEAMKKTEYKDKFTASFSEFIQNEINYHYWGRLLAYPIVNANQDKNILTVNPVPELMLEGFDKIAVNNEPALVSNSYRDFIKYYVIYFTSKTNGFKKFSDPSISADRKQAIARDRLQGACYSFWLSRFLAEECSYLSPYMVKKMQSILKESDSGNKFYAVVKEYSDAHTTEHPEQVAAAVGSTSKHASNSDELDLVDRSGKPVSLSDFKGKVVYIDFWASWCGPCRMMMPHSKELHEKLNAKQKKEIVFLYISIDANKEAWQKAIQDMGIEGTHAISPGNWGAKACKYFQINSIPRYMIMNKKGEVVDFNAKRPADPELLNELLKYADH